MKKVLTITASLLLVGAVSASAQGFLKKVGEAAKQAASQAVEQAISGNSSSSSSSSSSTSSSSSSFSSAGSILSKAASSASKGSSMKNTGKTYYVNCETGSNRNDGSKGAPLKDLQKAVDAATDGCVILVSEGNYLGTFNQGFIKVDKYITIQGGWSSDFSEWDPIAHKTMVQPTPECNGTGGDRGLIDIEIAAADVKENGLVCIDGLLLDMGQETQYYAPNEDIRASWPEGCETGRMTVIGESPRLPQIGNGITTHQLFHCSSFVGNLIIRNCVFENSYHFAIQVGITGNAYVYNNVFCANRMGGCEIRGTAKDQDKCHLDFHHNTVMFTWCRDKELGDMGQGFRFMTGIHSDCHDNIFGGNILGGIERTYYDSDKTREAARKTSAYNNRFFMNAHDIILPATGGGKWIFINADQAEDSDLFDRAEGNEELKADEAAAFQAAVDEPYLKGFCTLEQISSRSYNANSAANQFNRAFGLNQQGTETIRVSMYANRYPWAKAYDLFGTVSGFGAQTPVNEQ